VVPCVFGEWVHEHENSARIMRVDFQGTGIPSIFTTPSPERDWANLWLGVQMVLPQQVSLFVNYQSLLISGATNHTLEGGVRLEF